MLLGMSPQSGQQFGADVSMIGIVLGAHNHFAIDHLMEVAVLRQGLQFGLGPDPLYGFALRDHGVNVAALAKRVEAEIG